METMIRTWSKSGASRPWGLWPPGYTIPGSAAVNVVRGLSEGLVAWLAWSIASALAADAPPGTAWGKGTCGVLLLHDERGAPDDWGTLGPRLAASQCQVFAPALKTPPTIAEVRAAVGWLRAQGARTVHLVGAGLGANVALNAASSLPDVSGVALLSPELGEGDLGLARGMAGFDDRPLLVLTSTDDPRALRTATLAHRQARGPSHLERYPGHAHGTRLLSVSPDVERTLQSWVAGTPSRQDQTDLTHEVRTSDVGTLKTDGVRLDERPR